MSVGRGYQNGLLKSGDKNNTGYSGRVSSIL